MVSKKVQRQLKRAFGVNVLDDIVAQARALAIATAPGTPAAQGLIDFLDQIPSFLENIDRSYAEAEDRLIVASRNIDISSAELSRARDAVTSMVDSLTEGYLVVSERGVCDGVFSRVSTEIFEKSPAGLHLFDILRLTGDVREEAEGWLQLAFADRLGPTEMTELGPHAFTNGAGKQYRLSYGLIRAGGAVTGLIVIAADVTEELEAKRVADARVEEAKLITKLIEDKESFQSFARLAREVLDNVRALSVLDAADRDQFRFDLHTLKGGAASFFLHEVETCIHKVELELRAAPEADLDLVKEMAARVRAQLDQMIQRHQTVLGGGEDWLDQMTVKKSVIFDLVEAGLRQNVPEAFLDQMLAETSGVDVGQWLSSFESTVQVAARRLGKNVELVIEGETTRVPLAPYRRFFASLVHIFRNAVDHGIESTDDRVALGKVPRARITVRHGGPTPEHNGWWLSISDDGRGIDVPALRARYVASGRADAADLPEAELLDLLFDKSISTKTEISETSGMGVGMSALGQTLSALGVRREITTEHGRGTTVKFLMPRAQHLPEVKRELGLPDGPVRTSVDNELNFRYNEMISEIADLIRDARERERVDQEIMMARAVQKTLLPAESMAYGDFNIAGRSYTAGSCGGDWWYHARSGDHLAVWLGDVLGHGIASALVASACRATAGVLHLQSPEASVTEYFRVMNDVIHSMTDGEIYVTGVCMKINLATGDVEIGSASHPATLVINEAKGVSRPLPTPLSSPLGLKPHESYVSSHFRIGEGEGVFLMTDGLLDLNTRPGVRWSLPRILNYLTQALAQERSSDGMVRAIESFVFDHASGEMIDDTTYVAIYRDPAVSLIKAG